MLLDFPVDQRLNDGPQEFLCNDVNYLRTHLVENALNDGFHEDGVRSALTICERFGARL